MCSPGLSDVMGLLAQDSGPRAADLQKQILK
jgi:hypothetical protein